MEVKKISETWILEDPPDSKVQLDVLFQFNDVEITRIHVPKGSTILETAMELGIEQLKKHRKG